MLDGRSKESSAISLIIYRASINNPADINIVAKDSNDYIEVGYSVAWAQWSAFMNGGYVVRFKLQDPHTGTLSKFIGLGLLEWSRETRMYIRFRFGWGKFTYGGATDKLAWTTPRFAIITRIDGLGIDASNFNVEIEAIDPSSWYLNRGTASGRAYRGKIGGSVSGSKLENPRNGVIAQCILDYTEKIDVVVGDTIDSANNVWYMMRMEPKTFILTLMEWSSGITEYRTPWIVQSQDNCIVIKEMATLTAPNDHNGVPFVGRHIEVNGAQHGLTEILPGGITMLNNPLLTIVQSRLYTAGMSAVTGKYNDRVTALEHVVVNDLNTPHKLNANITQDRGFSKPLDQHDWSTFIESIPEHNNFDVGVKYWEYMSGRAIDYFIKMLCTVMRIRVKIVGDPNFDDVRILGPGSVHLSMFDKDGKAHMLSGEWMVYGFCHIFRPGAWETNLYLCRLDWNAVAKHITGITLPAVKKEKVVVKR